MATVKDLLARKGSQVHAVPVDATVLQVTQQMNEARIGAVVVTNNARIVGIFTERDVLRRVVAEERPPSAVRVGEVMTREVLCVAPDTPVDEVSRIMKDQRVRHLPVCAKDGHVIGMISIGDLNAYYASDREATLQFLHDYLHLG